MEIKETFKVVAGILKQDIEVQMIDLFAGEQKQDWFLKMNPKHQVPVLAIDDKTFISESVVICQYLCKVAGQNSLYPGKCNNTSPGAWSSDYLREPSVHR